MTRKRTPSNFQESELLDIVKLLNSRVGRKVEKTIAILESRGYQINWSRVTWVGGVASYQWMPRRGRYRLLISATKSGYSGIKFTTQEFAPGMSLWKETPAKRRGFKYGNCIEI